MTKKGLRKPRFRTSIRQVPGLSLAQVYTVVPSGRNAARLVLKEAQ